MERQRVLAIGLDGLELTLAERLMAEGRMPALSALRERSAWFRLEHGSAQRTGLAWEHFASGLSPDAGKRWAAVEFDPLTYEAWQEGARFAPWWSAMDRRVVVFDPPYVDIDRAPNTRGIVGWGAHDPGTAPRGEPADLMADFQERVGPYPATKWTYGLPWPSAARATAMGDALGTGLRIRTEAARWLAGERIRDWDLFLAVEGEIHGATEGMWHGVDPSHPLHDHPSGPAAGRAMVDLYRGLDEMVGALGEAAGDAAVVAFAMGGMGPNHSDAGSMVLLPELLYRHAFGRTLLTLPAAWTDNPGSVPGIAEDGSWSNVSRAWMPGPKKEVRKPAGPLRQLIRRLRRRLRPTAGRQGGKAAAAPATPAAAGPAAAAATPATPWYSPGSGRNTLTWQPASWYQPHWHAMPAFAIPSFYDGRIRLNVKGRERDGLIEPERYDATLDELEALLRECTNPRTGEPAVSGFDRASTRDPLQLAGSEADLQVVWNGVVLALEHPRLGLVGPIPMRRVAGHTGPHGVAFVAGPGIEPGDRGVRSSFDVAPTIARLMDAPMPPGSSGNSLL